MKIKKLFIIVFFGVTITSVVMVIIIYMMLQNHKALTDSEKIRFQSYQRADELRQSSDDLTRLARTYVVTGDPKYEKMYWDVLAIRNGELPRPLLYEKIYWDYMTNDGKKPRPDGKPIPLQKMFEQLGFSEDEFVKLKESQANSDGLVWIETIAMNAMKGLFDDGKGNFTIKGEPDYNMARRLMYSKDYHKEKVRIMKPIDDFFTLLDNRTKSSVEKYSSISNTYFVLLIILSSILIAFAVIGYSTINKNVLRRLGGEPSEIEKITKKVAVGDLDIKVEDVKESATGVLASVRTMVETLSKMANVANSITQGDLTIDVKPLSDRDILGKAFKTMVDTIRERAGQAEDIANGNLTIVVEPISEKDTLGTAFKTMVERLRSQINEITEGINVLASSTSEIMASVTQMALSASETATSVSETTTTVEEVKQTAEVSNHKAKEISESAFKTVEISNEGIKAINNTIEGMNKVKQQMESIANMVVGLSEQSQEVGEITSTVNDLAEQSNLLAVNAAIESAKAGEHGKGFTVVAQEIKKLAERSKEATAQVGSILKDIQKSVSSAVMATEEGGKVVEEGLRLTTISGKAIKTLSDSVDEAADVMIQIAASSQQQLEGMNQMVSTMGNIKESSVQAAASTKQSAESVNELQKLGDKLKELMNQYVGIN